MVFTAQISSEGSRSQGQLTARLCRKLHPARFTAMSRKMAALVGYVLDTAYVEPRIWELFVTSDGFLLGQVGDQVGADTFLGAYADFVHNWKQLLAAAGLTPEERLEADCRFAARVGVYGKISA